MFSISKPRLTAAFLLAGLCLPGQALARTYTLSPQSEIRYRGHHPAHTWDGVSHALQGALTVDEGEQPQVPMDISLPVRSFTSGNRNRDNNALGVLEAERFPTVSLHATRIEVLNRHQEGTATVGQLKVSGTLTFHGVEKPITVTLNGRQTGNELQVNGEFPLKLSDFQIKRPSLLFVPIDDQIMVTVALKATAK